MSPRKPATALPFDGYIRVSRVAGRAGASFMSPALQRETIARIAAFHGVTVGEVVEELDVSGGTPINERELGRLVRKVETGASGGLLVWKVSRFSRNLLDGVTAADRVRAAGGRIIGEDLDSKAPMGRAILGFLLGWAEEERDARRAGWRAAQERAAARHVHPTRTPVGYARDAEGRLVWDAKAAPTVAEVFRMRGRGASLQECADRLAEATGKGWSRSSMKGLLASQTYLGRIVIGADIYVERAHEPIVDVRTWQLAQRGGARPRHDGSLAAQGVLAGLIRCAGCGHLLSVTASGPPGARVASYTCRKRRASGTCPAPASAIVAKVDGIVRPRLDAQEAAGRATFDDYMEAVSDSARAFESATEEFNAFLEGASIAALGADAYNRQVARLREAVETTRDAWQTSESRASALLGLGATTGLEHDRAVARRLIESAALRKATRGRWDNVEDRLEVVWR